MKKLNNTQLKEVRRMFEDDEDGLLMIYAHLCFEDDITKNMLPDDIQLALELNHDELDRDFDDAYDRLLEYKEYAEEDAREEKYHNIIK